MPTVGDFVTFGDNASILQIDENNPIARVSYTPSLPSNLNERASARAIMTLRMEVESPNNLRWNTVVNGTTIFTFTHNINRFGAIQEVFPGSILNIGENIVTVTVLSGQGRLIVSDFALHHQVDV